MNKNKIYKAKLKPLKKCLKGCEVHENSKNYWKVVSWKDHKLNLTRPYIGFRTYYKSYFGGKTVNVKQHNKYSNILQLYSDKGMYMMDIFDHWVEHVDLEETEKAENNEILDNLLEKWNELF